MSLLSKAKAYAPKRQHSKYETYSDNESFEALESYIKGDVNVDALSVALTGKKGNASMSFLLYAIKRGFSNGRYTINLKK